MVPLRVALSRVQQDAESDLTSDYLKFHIYKTANNVTLLQKCFRLKNGEGPL